MQIQPSNSAANGTCRLLAAALALVLCAIPAVAVEPTPAAPPSEKVLDSVIAVVNNQIILASDLDLEMRIYRLLPLGDRRDSSPAKALERLTTRALIEQQILQEDPHGLEIAPKDLDESLTELRQNLPDCKNRDCVSPAGWAAYLATFDLDPSRVAAYWSNRMALLRFIEQRFRSGIRIAPEEIQKYYNESLLPNYARREDAPALDRVAPRIQEVLLQRQVNALMDDWLKSLQEQGQVEVLDASLRPPANATPDAHPPNPAPAIHIRPRTRLRRPGVLVPGTNTPTQLPAPAAAPGPNNPDDPGGLW